MFLQFLVELVEGEVVGEFHGAAGGVGEELADEVAAEEVGAGVANDLFEAGEVGVGFAGGEFAGGVDLGVFGLFGASDRFCASGDGSEASRLKPSGSILRWHSAQAASARCLASRSRMVVAPLTSGSIAGTTSGGGDGGTPRKFSVTHTPRVTGEVSTPFALTVSTAAMPSRPPRMVVALEADFLEAIGEAQFVLLRQFVEFREFLVHEGVLAVDELRDGAVVFEQIAEKEACLGFHRAGQILGVVGAVGFARWRLAAEIAEIEPTVDETIHEAVDAFIGDHSLDLLFELGVLAELAGLRGGQKLVIGRCGPKRIREARGEVVGLEALFRLIGDCEVKEARRAKDQFERIERRLTWRGFFGDALLVECNCIGFLSSVRGRR